MRNRKELNEDEGAKKRSLAKDKKENKKEGDNISSHEANFNNNDDKYNSSNRIRPYLVGESDWTTVTITTIENNYVNTAPHQCIYKRWKN